ncbi:MAG: transcription elongation factor GreA [Chloroflexia bacterium]
MNSSNRVQLTEQGLKNLHEELHHLDTVERPNVSERIKEAKEGGDISESGEYEDAKRHQAFVEGRIREIEHLLAHADVIDDSKRTAGVVSLGSTVTVEEDGQRDTYMIVNRAESGRNKNGEIRISDVSIVGNALLGRKVGDKVKVETPGGAVALTVVAVE